MLSDRSGMGSSPSLMWRSPPAPPDGAVGALVGPARRHVHSLWNDKVEKRAVRELAEAAGARTVHDRTAAAAAAGADFRLKSLAAKWLWTSVLATPRLPGFRCCIVYSRSVKVGGDHMDTAIIRHLETHHGITIGTVTAQRSRTGLDRAPQANQRTFEVRGRDVDSAFLGPCPLLKSTSVPRSQKRTDHRRGRHVEHGAHPP